MQKMAADQINFIRVLGLVNDKNMFKKQTVFFEKGLEKLICKFNFMSNKKIEFLKAGNHVTSNPILYQVVALLLVVW